MVAAAFEEQWQSAGDPTFAERHGLAAPLQSIQATVIREPSTKTIREVFELFNSDPTKQRTRKTELHYINLVDLIVGLWGEARTIQSLDREACRELLDTLIWLPTNAEKRFPKMTGVGASRMAKEKRIPGTLAAATVNGYMSKLRAMLNFAVNEGWIERNPAKDLQVNDPVRRRDKRLPFAVDQLRTIFNAPLYRGCLDDENGYSTPGSSLPRRGRFWVPLIALFSGMRLNEICQLDVADVVRVDGVDCFFVTEGPSDNATGKRLKTSSSERFIPIHPTLIEIGLMDFVGEKRGVGTVKLFSELRQSTTGYFSDPFSKWFRRFLLSAGAQRPKTCFHSFRHSYRDALRDARVDHETSMALGGWASTSGNDVAAAYGRGHRTQDLFTAIASVNYPDLDLSHLLRQ